MSIYDNFIGWTNQQIPLQFFLWYCLIGLIFIMFTGHVQTLTFTELSAPPETIHRPSGVNLSTSILRVWPWYVWMHLFFRMSHIFMFVSEDPDAKNSPKGWESREAQFDLCPVKVRTTVAIKSDIVTRYSYSWSFCFKCSQALWRLVHTFCFLNIPYFYCSACCSGTYHNLGGIKAQWLNWTCKAWEALQKRSDTHL